MEKKQIILGIVGATGLVGQTLIELLETMEFPYFSLKGLKLYASQASLGKTVSFQQTRLPVENVNIESLSQCQVVIFCAEAPLSKELIPLLSERGILCVDKSTAFRGHPAVPLVVPEVNGQTLGSSLTDLLCVSSPNCCAIPLAMALKPLSDAFGLRRVIVSTYQSVSGAGKAAIEALREETKTFFSRSQLFEVSSSVFAESIAFNVLPAIGPINTSGISDEEDKIQSETKKILGLPHLPLSVTSVRVPTFVGHGQSVAVELETPVVLADAVKALSSFPGLCFQEQPFYPGEDREDPHWPTPRGVHGSDGVYISRLRLSRAFEQGLDFWICSDNLRKGAALNALQIVDSFFKNHVMIT